MEDRQILEALWSRTESAIDALRAKFGRRLYLTALNILGDNRDAEEAVSDTYLALWDAIPPARPEPLSAFVYKVGRNTALKHLRRRSAEKRDNRYDTTLDELTEALSADAPEARIQARELGDAINRFLDTLDHSSRCLFVRRYWFGDSVRELSRVEGITENALSVRLHRIRGKLKDYLYKEGFWDEA